MTPIRIFYCKVQIVLSHTSSHLTLNNNPAEYYISLKDKDFKLYRKIITFSPSRQQMNADSKKCFISYMIAFKGVLIQSRFELTNPVHPLEFPFPGNKNKDSLQTRVTETMFLGEVAVTGMVF